MPAVHMDFPESISPVESNAIRMVGAVNGTWITCAVSDDGFNNSGLSTGRRFYAQFINRFIRFFKLLQVTGLHRICRVRSSCPQTTNNSGFINKVY